MASHGYGHELITGQTPEKFRDDVRKAKGILEDICGKRVYGYRAPSFSITKDTKWAISILIEEGYLYDSSIFPVLHDRYGMPDATPTIHLLRRRQVAYGRFLHRQPVFSGFDFQLQEGDISAYFPIPYCGNY